MTRRDAIAGGAGVAAAPFVAGGSRAAAFAAVDVAVIGAGAAGLAAARSLLAQGLTVAVVEARERVGGRVWTAEVAGLPFDAGAAYVHFRERNPWVGIARELGIALEEHRGWGQGRAFDGTDPLDAAAQATRAEGRRRLWRKLAAVTPGDDDTSLAAMAAGEDPFVKLAATRYGQQAIGEEPERISVRDLHLQWEGDDFTVPGGYGRLVAASGAGLPVTTGAPATTVRWDGPGVEIETAAGTLRARRAVVTLPVGVLAAGRVRFIPSLPPATLAAIGDLRPGALTKVALAVDGARFGLPSPTDLYEVRSGFVFELFPFDRDLILATIGGTPARDLVARGEAGAVAAATDVLAGMLGAAVRAHVVAGRLADWWTDPWALGSYSVAAPGRTAARRALAVPVAERLHFAGEATAVGGSMTAGGATLEGRAAAQAVATALGAGPATAR